MFPAMTAAQARLADTIDVFYGAADKTSESAIAAHAYKRAVEDLDTGITREMVSSKTRCLLIEALIGSAHTLGSTLPHDHHGAPWQDERVFPNYQ